MTPEPERNEQIWIQLVSLLTSGGIPLQELLRCREDEAQAVKTKKLDVR